MTTAERAAAGAAFLDEREPGWFQLIDLNRFDMEEDEYEREDTTSCGCVLAQTELSGSYHDHSKRLGLMAAEVVVLGFESYGPYADLTDAWFVEIKTRREATSALLEQLWR